MPIRAVGLTARCSSAWIGMPRTAPLTPRATIPPRAQRSSRDALDVLTARTRSENLQECTQATVNESLRRAAAGQANRRSGIVAATAAFGAHSGLRPQTIWGMQNEDMDACGRRGTDRVQPWRGPCRGQPRLGLGSRRGFDRLWGPDRALPQPAVRPRSRGFRWWRDRYPRSCW